MSIPRPIFPADFKFIDNYAKRIAEYLYTEVNNTFRDVVGGNVIKTYRTYNDIDIPLTDLPCLKVYRLNQKGYFQHSEVGTSDYRLSYISRPVRKKVHELNVYITEEIIRLLITAPLEEYDNLYVSLSDTTPISVEFETLVDPENTVFEYSNINISVFTRLGSYYY